MNANALENGTRLRVGAVSYLNTKPLVYELDGSPQIELLYDLPSRLADRLSAAELDVALIPSIEVFQDPSYRVISDACIGCRGPVWSVKLLSRTPISGIRTLALDEGSRTSVALVRILLDQRFGLRPQLVPLPLGSVPEDVDTDAVLVIGDRAMHTPPGAFREVWDLGEQWCEWSQLPFVFAMWTARGGIECGELAKRLQSARDAGVANLASIARTEAPKVNLDENQCLSYLRDNLYFFLGPRERRGLELFRRHAVAIGLAPATGLSLSTVVEDQSTVNSP